MLFWAFILLALFQAAGGIFLSNLSMDFVRNPTADVNARREVFRYYGTFSRSFLTMFATTTLPICSCFLFTPYYPLFFQPMVACHVSKVVSLVFSKRRISFGFFGGLLQYSISLCIGLLLPCLAALVCRKCSLRTGALHVVSLWTTSANGIQFSF